MTKVRIEFDERGLLSAVKRGNRKALRRVGAYVRQVARNAVKRSTQSSPPGRVPHTRQGHRR